MTVTPVVNQTTPVRAVPYLSIDMFGAHADRGVSINNLVPDGGVNDQRAALAGYIAQATGLIDSFVRCTLASTVDTERGTVSVGRDGYVYVQPRYRPVVALIAFSLGVNPATLQAYTSLDGAGVSDSAIMVPLGPWGLWNTSQGPIQLGPSGIGPGEGYGQWTYANGYPVTWLTAPAAAGAVLLTVADTTGIIGGQTQLTVEAGPARFTFIAGAVSTATPPLGGLGVGPGTVVCPALPMAVTTDTVYPTYVTGLPQDVIQAAVLGTRALIKKRGGGNLSAPLAGQQSSKQTDPFGAGDDLASMYNMLTSYQVLLP